MTVDLIDLEKRSRIRISNRTVVDGLRKAGLRGRDLSKTLITKTFRDRRPRGHPR